jgi:hypothetical protein
VEAGAEVAAHHCTGVQEITASPWQQQHTSTRARGNGGGGRLVEDVIQGVVVAARGATALAPRW